MFHDLYFSNILTSNVFPVVYLLGSTRLLSSTHLSRLCPFTLSLARYYLQALTEIRCALDDDLSKLATNATPFI